MDNILEINNVSKHYKAFSLDNVSMRLPKGCIMGFIGENGAGKSTTIKLILDLIHKDSGSITVMGTDHTKLDRRMKEHLGVVLDECYFPGEMTLKNVASVMQVFYHTWDPQRFAKLVKRYAIPSDRKVKEFSRGMRMKLSIAVALSHDTKLLILDEATSGLDPVVREEILDMLLDFIQNEEHSVFMSSHILSDLEKVCDYIAFIHEGKMILCENKDELLDAHGILKCSREALETVPAEAVIGVHTYAFGAEALVLKNHVAFETEPATLEQIMLYYTKNRVNDGGVKGALR